MTESVPIWIVAIATVVYAFFTGWIIREMRKDRKLSYKPIIKAILIGDFYPKRLRFEIKNVGKGPALNLKFNCMDNGEIQWKIQKEILPIGSSEKAEVIFIFDQDTFKPGDEIFLNVEYSDIFKKIYKERLLTLNAEKVMQDIGVTER